MSNETETEIVVGDVVTLRSGGPNMTVDWVDKLAQAGRMASTVWFEGVELRHQLIACASLKKVRDE